jgi:hypothetical protein
MLETEVHAVRRVQPLHEPMHIPYWRLDEQMVMVRHEHVGIQDNPVRLKRGVQLL